MSRTVCCVKETVQMSTLLYIKSR